jgi:hypothetical protein
VKPSISSKKQDRICFVREAWPLWCAVFAYLLVLAVQVWIIKFHNHDQQIYALDDPYIHAAVAKNLVLHHIYGVTRYEKSFACSSIFWPFIVAIGFLIVGVHAWVPLAINVVLSVVYLTITYAFFRRFMKTSSPRLVALLLFLLVFTVPLLFLSFIGMEHILHAFAFLLLLWAYGRVTQERDSRSARLLLLLSAIFIVGVRYEGLFTISILCCLLIFRRLWLLALAVGFVSAIPPIAYGLVSLRNGSTFLPAPLLLKTAEVRHAWYLSMANNLIERQAIKGGIVLMLVLCAAMVLFLWRRRDERSQPQMDWLIILTGTFLLHAQFARFGWLFRYEAYLLATGLIVLFAALADIREHIEGRFSRAVYIWLPWLLFAGLIGRGATLLYITITQAHLISEQQYQTAMFLRRFYSGKAVALNDIGAPNYFTELRCLDLYGLGSSEVERLRLQNRFDRDAVDRLTSRKGVEIAIIYDPWFVNKVPKSWVSVSRWKIMDLPHHPGIGYDTVDFYAVDAKQARRLAEHIREFQRDLPDTVQVTNLPLPADLPN